MTAARCILRRGGAAHDAICGRILGKALAAGPLPDALPFARAALTSVAPLPLERGRRRLLAMNGEAMPVGFADYTRATAVVNYLFVLPEMQRQGIGGALLQGASAAIGRPVSVTVLAANGPALAFYERRGFVEVERWHEPSWHGGPADWLRLAERTAPDGAGALA